ncbi:ABC_transporter family protein [Hexamita inflata]|uniref:ABC transporter family protein n=1 Tax=Hexamita inflata TaxID=28002 RepID=A0AA86P1L9_9EUKA|nr:ABC transporter family protein [Hexamita inflata]
MLIKIDKQFSICYYSSVFVNVRPAEVQSKKIQQYVLQNLIELGQISGQNQNIVNFNFLQLENDMIDSKLSGNIKLEISQPVPNRGSTSDSYSMNKRTYSMLLPREIKCDGTVSQMKRDYQTYWLPSMQKPHESFKMNSKELQSLPDREHVTLFDVQNEPFTQLMTNVLMISFTNYIKIIIKIHSFYGIIKLNLFISRFGYVQSALIIK